MVVVVAGTRNRNAKKLWRERERAVQEKKSICEGNEIRRIFDLCKIRVDRMAARRWPNRPRGRREGILLLYIVLQP